jgi:hypothetical protein
MSLRGAKRRGNLFQFLSIRNGLLPASQARCRNDGKSTSSCKYSSWRGVVKQRLGNLIKTVGDCFVALLLAMTLTTAPCQAAIEFDGANDYIRLNADAELDFTSSYSFSTWLKSPLPNASRYHGIWWRGLAENQSDIEIYVQASSNDLIVAHNRGNSGTFDFVGFSDPPNDTWYHLVVTYNNNTMNVYYDGVMQTVVQQTKTSFADPLVTASNITKLGSLGTALGFSPVYFNGSIDDARIYNRELSNGEILALYNSRSKRPSGSLANGLIAHYEMDDDAIGEVTAQAKDSSGNLNHGEFINFDNIVSNGFSNDIPGNIGIGTSLEFDGVDDYIEVLDSPVLKPNTLSISTWVKLNSLINGSSVKAIVAKASANQGYQIIVLGSGQAGDDNEVRFDFGDGSNWLRLDSEESLTTGAWHHIIATLNGTTGELFIDNESKGRKSNPGVINYGTQVLKLGDGVDVTSRDLDGYIDETRIYNKQLTASEINFLYNGSGMDPGTSNLQALWTFDDSALKDSSGNDNHGVGRGRDSLKYTEGILRR